MLAGLHQFQDSGTQLAFGKAFPGRQHRKVGQQSFVQICPIDGVGHTLSGQPPQIGNPALDH